MRSRPAVTKNAVINYLCLEGTWGRLQVTHRTWEPGEISDRHDALASLILAAVFVDQDNGWRLKADAALLCNVSHYSSSCWLQRGQLYQRCPQEPQSSLKNRKRKKGKKVWVSLGPVLSVRVRVTQVQQRHAARVSLWFQWNVNRSLHSLWAGCQGAEWIPTPGLHPCHKRYFLDIY